MDNIKNALVVFQGKKIRRTWFNDEWWFSVVDIVGALTQTDRSRKYWSDLKVKLIEEGFEVSEKIGQLKLMAEQYGQEILEPQLRPEYIEKLKRIKKQDGIRFKNISVL